MQIQLDRVRDEPFTWDCEVPAAAADLDREELLALGPVRWQGRIEETSAGFLLRGRLRYEQTLACSRCTAPRVDTVESALELLIVPRESVPLPGDLELDETDLNVLEVDADTLDTLPLVLDQLQLEVPMRVLCRPDCAGLCPRCGTNLNLGPCGCPEREIDPRWQALSDIRGRFEG